MEPVFYGYPDCHKLNMDNELNKKMDTDTNPDILKKLDIRIDYRESKCLFHILFSLVNSEARCKKSYICEKVKIFYNYCNAFTS